MSPDQKITVLLVEDEITTADALKRLLSGEPDIQVIGAVADYKAGLSLAEERQPDAVLLDLQLAGAPHPRSLLRGFRTVCPAKLVAFSGEDQDVFIQSMIVAGADGYIHKSKPAGEIARSLRELVTGQTPSRPFRHLSDNCSFAERQILRLLARGMQYEEIAELRDTTPETVVKQCQRIQSKLNLSTSKDLLDWAIASGYGVSAE